MKTKIHPQYFPTATVSCNCGTSFEVGATVESIQVEVCSACHPFYTGKQNLVDTAGRVDKFKARAEKAASIKAAKKTKADPSPEQKDTKTQTEKLKELRKQVS